ncbi:MAG: VWA domain-containing protein [Candidatus Bipolaricaulota bacterium]
MIRFLVPWALATLLLPLGVLLFSGRRALWGRAITMALLAVALAQPEIARREADPALLVLVDRSKSVVEGMDDAYNQLAPQLRGHSGPAGLIEFAGSPQLTHPPGPGLPTLATGAPALDTMATDIGAAIDLALGVTGDAPAHIVLVSDGQATSGDLWAAAVRARDRDVPVSVVPVDVLDPVRVASLEGPLQTPLGEIVLEGRIEADKNVEAEVLWLRNKQVFHRSSQELSPGMHSLQLAVELERPGPHEFSLEVKVDDDPIPANNRLDWVVMAGEPSTALVVGEAEAAAQLLQASGLDTRVRSSFSPTDLTGVELAVLDDWPLAGLSRADLDALRAHVVGGGGLLVVQGRQAVEGYAGALEDLLPVTYSVPGRLEESPAAIVFVMDRSASMAATTAGAQHIDLLKEAAASAVEAMHKDDVVGAIAFDRYSSSLIEPGPVAEVKEALYERLRTLTPVGGTDLVPAMRDALAVLEPIDTRIKHIVILSDGKTLPRPGLPDLYDEVAESGAGVTSIALGADADLESLGELARAAQGEFLIVEDARDLRQVFVGEAQQARRPRYRQGEFPVLPGPHAASLGLAELELPDLKGYVLTFPKATAEVGLITPEGDPLVAGWQLGLGRVSVLNVDLGGRWSGDWMASPSLGELWGSLVGWLWSPRDDVLLDWSLEKGLLELRLDVQQEGRWVSGLSFRGELGGAGNPHEIGFEPSAPGRYLARVPYEGAGPHVLSVWDEGGRYGDTFGLALPYNQELAELGADLETLASLAELTGGQLLEDELSPSAGAGRTWIPVERGLLWAAAVAFLADLALRKVRFVSPRGSHSGRA